MFGGIARLGILILEMLHTTQKLAPECENFWEFFWILEDFLKFLFAQGVSFILDVSWQETSVQQFTAPSNVIVLKGDWKTHIVWRYCSLQIKAIMLNSVSFIADMFS